jgi:HKD family nuclease
MIRLLNSSQVAQRFEHLISKSTAVDIAVAWATLCPQTKRVLDLAEKRSLRARILVGVGGYLTDPLHLEAFSQNAELRIFGKPTGTLFHPKMYVFQLNSESVSWAGSANLTHSGFQKNVEMIAEFVDHKKIASTEFERLWNSEAAVPLDQFDIETYRLERNELLRSIPPNIRRRLNLPHSPTPVDQVLSDGWSAYYNELKAIRPDTGRGLDLSNWLDVLDARHNLINRDWTADFSEPEIGLLLGINPFAPFGRLDARSKNKFIGTNGRDRMLIIGDVVKSVMEMTYVDAGKIEAALGKLLSLHSVGPAMATRLLTLIRPDWFIVVNKKSFEGLATRFRCDTTRYIRPADYMNLVSRIHSQPWWKSSAPEDADELRLWNYRAALIDPLVYSGDDPAVMG